MRTWRPRRRSTIAAYYYVLLIVLPLLIPPPEPLRTAPSVLLRSITDVTCGVFHADSSGRREPETGFVVQSLQEEKKVIAEPL